MTQKEMQDKISSLLTNRGYTQQGNGRLSRRYRHPSWQKVSNPIVSRFLFLHVYIHAARFRIFLELRSSTRDFTYNEKRDILLLSSCVRRRYITLFEFYNEPFESQNTKLQTGHILELLKNSFYVWNDHGQQTTPYRNNLQKKLDIYL